MRVMNLNQDTIQTWIDRMVDGELSDQQRREMLRWLEDHPSHWRTLALTYCESTVLRSDLVEFVSHHEPDGRPSTVSVTGTTRPNQRRLWDWLAIAAGLMLALSLGVGLGTNVARRSNQGVIRANPAVASSADESTPMPSMRPDGSEPVYVVLDNEPSPTDSPIRLPVISNHRLGPSWPAYRSTMTPDLVRTLEESGRTVTQQRHWMPVLLNDGRQAVVPVDNIDVQWQDYQ